MWSVGLGEGIDWGRTRIARPSGAGVFLLGLLFLEFEFVAVELELVVLEVEVLLFLAFADFDFDLAGFEFVLAEA